MCEERGAGEAPPCARHARAAASPMEAQPTPVPRRRKRLRPPRTTRGAAAARGRKRALVAPPARARACARWHTSRGQCGSRDACCAHAAAVCVGPRAHCANTKQTIKKKSALDIITIVKTFFAQALFAARSDSKRVDVPPCSPGRGVVRKAEARAARCRPSPGAHHTTRAHD